MKISVLGSGSTGNSVLVIGRDGGLLIDAGFSARNLFQRLEMIDVTPDIIRGILITHEHTDHIRGAGVLARRLKTPVFATEATLDAGKRSLGNLPEVSLIHAGTPFDFAGFSIHPVSVSHDAADPVAFRIAQGDIQVGVCTDLGFVTHLVRKRFQDCHALVLEMNHDVNMLMTGPYPWRLKQRIRSRIGHLSNQSGGELLKALHGPDLKLVFLAHLSRENNLPGLAMAAAHQTFSGKPDSEKPVIQVAEQDTPSSLFTLNGAPVEA